MTGRALALMTLAVLVAGCLSTPPSGVITCDNSCPISGFYCAGDGYCWANGEYPSLTSSTATGGSTSAGTGAEMTGASGSNSTGGSSTGKTGTGGSSTGGKTSTGTTGR